jgi:hypothetical protein
VFIVEHLARAEAALPTSNAIAALARIFDDILQK